MRVRVLVQIGLTSGKTLQPGEIIELPDSMLAKLAGKVKPITDGKGLTHYCAPGACWCSEKLPGSDHPKGCARTNCDHHKETNA